MAQQFATVEITILVDHCGDWAHGADAAAAKEQYEENIQPLGDCDGFRLVTVKVKVPLPETATVELEAEAPELEQPAAA